MTTPPARLKPIHLPLHRGGFFGGARTQLRIRILRQPGIEASVETMKPPHPLAPLRKGSCQRQLTEGSPNRLPLEGKVSAQPTDEVFFQRRIQIKQAEIASARPAAYSSVSTSASTPGHRNKCIGRRLNAPLKKPVGETPTGSALFNYVLGVSSATIVNTKVLGVAK